MDTEVLDLKPEPAAEGHARAVVQLPGLLVAGSRERLGEQAEPTSSRRAALKILLVTSTAAALAGAVAMGVFSARNADLRREVASLARWRASAADSLRLARDYPNVLGEVYELQQEISARQRGVVPALLAFRPQGAGIGALAGSRVVPAYYQLEPDAKERALARASIDGELPRDPQTRLYVRQDVVDSGALAPLAGRGLKLELRGGEHRWPTNAITFGPDVPPRDAVDVAYRVVASGILVRRIRRSADPAYRHTIELSYSRQVADWPEVTVAELRRFAGELAQR
jgi:hypothetical protein